MAPPYFSLEKTARVETFRRQASPHFTHSPNTSKLDDMEYDFPEILSRCSHLSDEEREAARERLNRFVRILLDIARDPTTREKLDRLTKS